MSKVRGRIGVCLSVCLLLFGCSATPGRAGQLTVLAAASLGNVMPDLAAAWKSTHGQTEILSSTGSSAALRTQIEQGAPADVFLSADTSNPQTLIDEDQALGPLTVYATNELTLIVPADNPAGITSALDLAKPGVCVIGAGENVPINKYAEQLVANLARLPDYGAAFSSGYEANICTREDNVAAVVSKISLGEGDAAIVYTTDATAGQNLKNIEIPAVANVLATYGGVVIKTSADTTMANDFLVWLTGADGQQVLKAHGFGPRP